MALESRLEVKLLQKLVLTPQLQQAIKLLQMPQLELSQTLTNELIENPLLEEASDEEEDDEPGAESGFPSASGENGQSANSSEPQAEESYEQGQEVDFERFGTLSVEEYFEERGQDGRDLGYFNPGTVAASDYEQFVPQGESLQDHLMWQLRLMSVPEELFPLAEAAVGNIDDSGYLRTTVEDIAASEGASVKDAAKALLIVQRLDPPGVGARSLKECLLIQLRARGEEGALAEAIIRDSLEDLVKKKYKQIASAHNAPLNSVLDAVKAIESLDPKPGGNFSSAQTQYIAPDVFVVKTGGEYRIVLNDEHIPTLRINRYYKRLLLHKQSLTKEERQYLEEKLRSAAWFLKSLDHRNKTIYRVTECILNIQREFFDAGVQYLKPMNLRDVAETLQMHESTISRATSNKYLSCSHGIFGFRFFFSSGLKCAEGSVSSTTVKEMIRKIVSEENHSKPLSDQRISHLLAEKGIKVARRTIAKYREEMNITSQSMRKNSQIKEAV